MSVAQLGITTTAWSTNSSPPTPRTHDDLDLACVCRARRQWSLASGYLSPVARFPDVRVELPDGYSEDPHAGKSLRARTRLALEKAGLMRESLEYLAETKHLQGEASRAELLHVTQEWLTVTGEVGENAD